MKSQCVRLSKVERRRRRKDSYLSKTFPQRVDWSCLSSESVYDSCDDGGLVCTNCVERDIYLARFCDELLYSPSSAIYHLQGLMNNPQFPKGDLYRLSDQSSIVPVPVTTVSCGDCCTSIIEDNDDEDDKNSNSEFETSATSALPSYNNYDKQRREMERELINNIYELVCDQQVNSPSKTINSQSRRSSRITKLHVSEMAIARMENVQKINYSSQIERIKHKLLLSYRAFERLDQYIESHYSDNNHRLPSSMIKMPNYHQKIKSLERSFHNSQCYDS